jgi:hypothetical protein
MTGPALGRNLLEERLFWDRPLNGNKFCPTMDAMDLFASLSE